MNKRLWHIGFLSVLCLVVVGLMVGSAFAVPDMAEPQGKKNMKLIGYNDVQGRETLQVTTNYDGDTGKFWAFIGHHNRGSHQTIHYNPLTARNEENGTTILDTTDPSNPIVVAHIPNFAFSGPTGAGGDPCCNQENRNSRSTSVVFNFMGQGKDILVRNSEGSGTWYFEVFDITDIIRGNNPVGYHKIGNLGATNLGDLVGNAHKGYLSESGFYYGAAGEDSSTFTSGAHLVVWDIRYVATMDEGDYGWTNELGAGHFVGRAFLNQQKLTNPDPQSLTWHHPIVDEDNSRVYGAYLSGGNVVSVDIDFHDGAPNPNGKRFPIVWKIDNQPPYSGTHTVAPVYYDSVINFGSEGGPSEPRVYALVSDEGTGGSILCSSDIRQKAYMFDITDADETGVPYPMETWQVPDLSDGTDYCAKGGRFGPHQFNETINAHINPFTDKIAYFAYFNAGVRAIDISDPANMKEVGYYVPKANANTSGVTASQDAAGYKVIQINDVDVDARGLVNATDRVGSGFFLLEFTK
jgi:LVIVD repeat